MGMLYLFYLKANERLDYPNSVTGVFYYHSYIEKVLKKIIVLERTDEYCYRKLCSLLLNLI